MLILLLLCFFVLMGIGIMIYLMPVDSAKAKRKKEKATLRPDPIRLVPEKDWKSIAERWEKNNNALLGDVEKLKMQEKKWLHEIEEQKALHKDMLDKLALEKGWREKEQVNLDKARHHEKDLKDQIIRTEKDLEREHSNRLRIEREYQDIKIKHDAVVEEKRTATTKASSLETTVAALSKEIRELKAENAKLKEKREDIQWVAKSAYDELKKEFDSFKQRHGA